MFRFKMIIFVLLYSISASAFVSPFPSTVDSLTIPNAHQVDESAQIFRGMSPQGHVEELVGLGITDVLIFKNQGTFEVIQEIGELLVAGYSPTNIHHIPFRWSEFYSYTEACEQIVKGLQLIRKTYQSKTKKLYFHCTVGEDRTGTLAALWQMLLEGRARADVFENVMCLNGYGNGNPEKPDLVVHQIQRDLTPLFEAMAQKIENQELRLDELSKQSCRNIEVRPSKLRCAPSSRYPRTQE